MVVGLVGSSELLFLKTHSPVVKAGTSGRKKTWCTAGKFLAKNTAAWPSGGAGGGREEHKGEVTGLAMPVCGGHCALPLPTKGTFSSLY